MEDYYNPRTGLGSAYKFYKSQKNGKYTVEQIKEMLNKQEAFQLNKQGTKTAYFPIVGKGPGSYQGDLMFLDTYKGYIGIFTVINVITRVAYAYAIKSKTDTYKAVAQFLDDCKDVRYLQTDNGSEFLNQKVQALIKERSIEFNTVAPGDHTGQGKIERFNGTLRRLITVYETAYKTKNWVSVLDDLLYNYNHRCHRSLGCSLVDANEEGEFSKLLSKIETAERQFEVFKAGDRVRISIKKQLFDKGRKEWSHEIYTIEKIKGHQLLVNGVWYKHYELQKIGAVHKKLFDSNEPIDRVAVKKDKKIKRDIRKEGVENENVIEYGKNLVGRKVKDGSDRGVILKYDRIGPFHWTVRFDNDRDDETMDLTEIKRMLI